MENDLIVNVPKEVGNGKERGRKSGPVPQESSKDRTDPTSDLSLLGTRGHLVIDITKIIMTSIRERLAYQ